MKKVFLVLLALCLSSSLAFAQYVAPISDPPSNSNAALEQGGRVHFDAAFQGTSTPMVIGTIVWASASGNEIGGTGSFILEEANGDFIAGCEATTVSDQCIINFSIPQAVNGMWVSSLVGGDVTVYGKRR